MSQEEIINIKIKCLEITVADKNISVKDIKTEAENLYNWVVSINN